MLSMMKSAWAAMSLPPTILRSASMATWPDSCRRVLSPSSTRATWEYPPAGAGTVAGLSKMTMMSASFRVKSSPSWTEPGRPRYPPRDCTWTIRGVRHEAEAHRLPGSATKGRSDKEIDFAERPVAFLLVHRRVPGHPATPDLSVVCFAGGLLQPG